MYTKGELIEFFSRCFGKFKDYNNGLNIYVRCPNPNCQSLSDPDKKKFVIETVNNFQAHCWVCQEKTKAIFYTIKKYKNSELLQEFIDRFSNNKNYYFDEESFITKTEIELKLPESFRLLVEFDKENKIIKPYYKYLESRNVSYEDFWYFKLGCALDDEKYSNRIIIPSFDENGKLNYFTTRAILPNMSLQKLHCTATKEKIIFNEINIDWTRPLTIVEGPFDLMKSNKNSVCLLGSSLSKEHLLFMKICENKTPVILALDKDAVKKTYKMAKLFYEYDIDVKILEPEENDIGSMTKEYFFEYLKAAKEFNMKEYSDYKLNSVEC